MLESTLLYYLLFSIDVFFFIIDLFNRKMSKINTTKIITKSYIIILYFVNSYGIYLIY